MGANEAVVRLSMTCRRLKEAEKMILEDFPRTELPAEAERFKRAKQKMIQDEVKITVLTHFLHYVKFKGRRHLRELRRSSRR